MHIPITPAVPQQPSTTSTADVQLTSDPSGPKSAQLKSNRSFTLTEMLVCSSVLPMASAMELNRFEKTLSRIGSASFWALDDDDEEEGEEEDMLCCSWCEGYSEEQSLGNVDTSRNQTRRRGPGNAAVSGVEECTDEAKSEREGAKCTVRVGCLSIFDM